MGKTSVHRDEKGVRKQEYSRYSTSKGDYKVLPTSQMEAILMCEQENVKRNIGVPKFKSKEELRNKIIEYWQYLIDRNAEGIRLIPDVEGMASYLGVTRKTLAEWEKTDYLGFAEVVSIAKNAIASCKKQLSLNGAIPPVVFAIDFNNNHGYTQKQEYVITPQNPLGALQEPKEIQEKYKELPGD